MALDYESHSYIIYSSRKDKLLATQLWYEGMKEICSDAKLNSSNIKIYCDIESAKYDFKKFWDADIDEKYHSMVLDEKLIPIFLPVQKDFHLALFLDKNIDKSKGYGDRCVIFEHPIKELDNKIYPYVKLRVNIDSSVSDIPGLVEYNNLLHNSLDSFITNIKPDLLIDCYDSFNYLIHYGRVKDNRL